MAKTIAALNATLSLDARRFQAGMKRAKDPLRKFRNEIRQSQKRLKRFADSLGEKQGGATASLLRFGKALIGLAVLRKVAGYTAQLVREIDAIGKASKKIGATVEGLQAIDQAAKMASIRVRTANMALQRMTRRMAEAAAGTGEAKAAIKQLGIDASQLVTMTADEQFFAIADAMGNVDNQAEKLRLSFKLFDSEGAEMVNVLNMGREALEAIRDEGQKTGTIIGKDLVDNVEKLTNSLAMFYDGLKGKAATNLGGVAAYAARSIDEWSKLLGLTTEAAQVSAQYAVLNAQTDPRLQAIQNQKEAERKRQEAADEKEKEKREKAAEAFKSASEGLDGFVRGLADDFRDPRELFLRDLAEAAGKTELGLNDPRVEEAIRLYDKKTRLDRENERKDQIRGTLQGLFSEQESIADKLAGIQGPGALGFGGSAATGQVGTLAGAQAAGAARQGLARLQQVNDESRRLLQQLVRIQEDIRVIQRKSERIVREDIPA